MKSSKASSSKRATTTNCAVCGLLPKHLFHQYPDGRVICKACTVFGQRKRASKVVLHCATGNNNCLDAGSNAVTLSSGSTYRFICQACRYNKWNSIVNHRRQHNVGNENDHSDGTIIEVTKARNTVSLEIRFSTLLKSTLKLIDQSQNVMFQYFNFSIPFISIPLFVTDGHEKRFVLLLWLFFTG